jgi:photosystem II stability/assembly factor-like uncharacterized protein
MGRKLIASITLALLLVLVVPVPSAGAAGHWTSQDSGATQRLEDIAFVDSEVGWAVGYAGTILHTVDGGATWTSQTSGTIERLYGVDFSDGMTGWAVGNAGTILHTADGGATWTSQDSGTTVSLLTVEFTSPQSGCAAGGNPQSTLLYTEDAGTTWQTRISRGINDFIHSVSFANATRGLAAGSYNGAGVVYATADGGFSWTPISEGGPIHLAVELVDPDLGWLAGTSGHVWETTNGGASWTAQPVPPPPSLGYYVGMDFVDATTGWVVGDGGTILRYQSTQSGVSVSADAPAPTELSLTFSVTAGTAPDGGTVSDTSIDFGTLAANTPKTGSHELQVTTSASNGYQVTASEDTSLTNGTFSIPDVTGDNNDITESVAGAWDLATTHGFGYALADVTGSAASFTTGYKQFADESGAEAPQDVMTALSPAVDDTVDVLYKLNIGPEQAQGAYSNTITYVATGNL